MKARHALPVLFAAFLSIPSPRSFADENEKDVSVFGRRYDAFLLLLADRSLSAVHPEQWSKVGDASRQILIVVGERIDWDRIGIDARSFVERGGRLLVATDRPTTIPLPDSLIIHVVNIGTLEGTTRADHLPDRASCLISSDREFHRPNSTLFKGVESIVFNHPALLSSNTQRSDGWVTLPRTLRPPVRHPVVVAGAEEDRGRWLVVADQSPFSNEMILEGDNSPWTDNVVDWLTEGLAEQSAEVAVVIDGVPQTELLDTRFAEGDWSKKPPMTEIVNTLLDGLQSEDTFNRLIREGQDGWAGSRPWWVWQIALIGFASFAAARILMLLTRARRQVNSLFSERELSLATGGRAGAIGKGLLASRQEDLRSAENYAGLLGNLARDFFRRHWKIELGSSAAPRLASASFVERRWIRGLWRRAYGPDHSPLSKSSFQNWQARMARLEKKIRESGIA